MLNINQVVNSVHGELPFIGAPCTIIRLQGCNLACKYCDTKESISSTVGRMYSVGDLVDWVKTYGMKDVLITGGEPLLQKEDVVLLCQNLEGENRIVIETNGTVPIPIKLFELETHIVMDYKTFRLTPAQRAVLDENIDKLASYGGWLKFVLDKPFEEVKGSKILDTLKMISRLEEVHIIISFTNKLFFQSWMPFIQELSRTSLSEIRMQVQMHKIVEVM